LERDCKCVCVLLVLSSYFLQVNTT
jgi:hypothetical protein